MCGEEHFQNKCVTEREMRGKADWAISGAALRAAGGEAPYTSTNRVVFNGLYYGGNPAD